MDFMLLKDFLTYYSLPTITVAIIVSLLTFAVDKLFKNKLPDLLRSFTPFILAIAFYFGYDILLVHQAFILKTDALYAGILSGSLSIIICKSVKKIMSGKPLTFSATILLIEGILQEYINESKVFDVAVKIEKMLLSNDKNSPNKETVIDELKQHSENLSDNELNHLADLLIVATKAINVKK